MWPSPRWMIMKQRYTKSSGSATTVFLWNGFYREMGLANLYWANCRLDGYERELSAQDVTAGAHAGDQYCQRAVADFCNILGSVAGDVALMMGAIDAVFLSGGILPRLLNILDEAAFRQRFNSKGRFSEICSKIPLAIVLAEHPGLQGCVQALRKN